MKILFIYPEFPDTFWSFKHALRFVHKKAGAPPLGLLTVAAMLPYEWKKRLVDLNVTSLADEDITWADYVFVSALIVQRESAHSVTHRCKIADIKVVAGGPLFMMEHEQFPEVDHFVLNEAEETLAPFLLDLERNQAKHVYTSAEFIDFIQKSGIVTAMVGLLQAPLGTRLYERMQKEERLVHEFSGDNVDGSTNIIPRMEPLQEGYRKILSQIYAPELYYERVRTFLREYQPSRIRVQWEPQYIMALWRSIYQLGIRGVERIQYWQLFFWTLFRRPRLFPLAITFSIYGFHFRQVIALHVN